MADKMVSVASSPTSAASFISPAIRESPPQMSSETGDVGTNAHSSSIQQHSPKPASVPGSRKRVFTFQKRWLHSLPIVERSLPEVEMNDRVMKANRTDGGVLAAEASSAAIADMDKQKNVIACMLCDDPASKSELTKVWSRLNCRRGRIESHLMSKHPEFMRLLKHKREAEGDLAVQIFLQNLRDGRCNARTEIKNGLYSQLTTVGPVHFSPAAASHTDLQKRALNDYVNIREDLEGNRKRAKLTGSPANEKDALAMAASVYSAGNMAILRASADTASASVGSLTSSVLYQDAVMSAQWHSVFFNKLVVVTGGDNQSMSSVATQLWFLGANVLLAFTNMSALDDFNTKHIGRFPDPSDSEESPRGVMLPVLGSFRTQTDISEWCSSIAMKYQRVDFLINYVGPEVVQALSSKDVSGPTKSELIVSSAALIEALCDSMSSTCFPDRTASEDGWLIFNSGTIVNVSTSQDNAVIESLVKSLAAKLQPRNIQVNCVLLPRQMGEAVDVEISNVTATLSHSILFLLSPSSRLLSGSVLRLQQDKTLQASAAVVRRRDVPRSATEIHS